MASPGGVGVLELGMSATGGSERTPFARPDRQGVSPTVAGVVLVVVILVIAGVGYLVLQSAGPTKSSSTTCTPSTACASTANDVTLFVPQQPGYGQQYAQLTADQAFSGTVIPTGSETVRTYSIAWGDGTSTPSASPTITHEYTNAGLYVMAADVTDTAGLVHTGTSGLFPVNVNLSFGNFSLGTYPSISTTFNNGSGGFEPWVTVGTTVTVGAAYVGMPSTPGWSNGPMSIVAGPGAVQKTYSGGTSATGSYALTTPGTVNITLKGSSTGPGGASNPISYTWAVYVAPVGTPLGCKYCTPPVAKSPHPGSIVAYEIAPGGPVTLDPAADYYTVGAEVSLNIFQDLIQYNGTDVGPAYTNYVPQIATCVPGSPQCTSQFPSEPNGESALVNGYNYTFVIAKTAKFYDPTTGKSWPVYPSDVFFSFARELAFADLPEVEVNPGWIEAQALLPTGNPAWDSGIHAPYNNTPQNILGSMLVNDSSFCPASALSGASGNGCITFRVDGAGQPWPAFLSYMSHGTAANVVPAGWFIANGATVPGFPSTGGDFPVLLPGGVSSTNTTAFQSFVASQGPVSWDTYEGLAVTDYPTLEPGVAFNEVGSGPYYLKNANPAIGYSLVANPAYVQPAGCAGDSWCQPAPGLYARSVTVYWESDDTEGIEATVAGEADFVSIEPSDTATMLALVQKGDLKLTTAPSTDVFNFAYNPVIDVSSLRTYDPYPVNIQPNTLSYIGLRGFLDAAYPYASVQAQFNQIEGIQYGFNYGGFIPEYMGDYYPTNISWPNYDVTTGQFTNPNPSASAPGSAGWYWAQLTDPSSPIYDPQFGPGGYSASNPLHIPALYFLGDPTHQSVLNLWSSEVQALSGGAIVFDVFPESPAIVYASILPNGQTPWAIAFTGWAADYAQPFDYWANYGLGDTTAWQLFEQPAFSAASCVSGDGWSVLTYWANQQSIPQDCQGPAFQSALYWANVANTNLNIAQGTIEWNQIDAVYSLLNLVANTEQTNSIITVAPWVNVASINANLLNGFPGGENVWYTFQGNGLS